MPAPGRMDGHMSKASRDLSKGIAVKSNGFKYGGGKDGDGGRAARRAAAWGREAGAETSRPEPG